MVIDVILIAVSVIVPITRWEYTKQCKTPIGIWLLVEAGIYVLSLVKSIIVLIAIHQTNNTKSPREVKTKIEFTYICLVVNF